MQTSKKAIPNLPSSSRMQMPSGGNASIKKTPMNGKATAAVKGGGVSKGVLGSKKKVMPKKPY